MAGDDKGARSRETGPGPNAEAERKRAERQPPKRPSQGETHQHSDRMVRPGRDTVTK